MKKWILGIDVGGTKTSFGAFLFENNTLNPDPLLFEKTPTLQDKKKFLENISVYIKKFAENLGSYPLYSGICLPGQIDKYTSNLLYAPNLNFKTLNYQEELKPLFHTPLKVLNDVQSAAFGDKFFLPKAHSLFTCSLGTGIGGGFLLEDCLFQGFNGMAGEIGHIEIGGNFLCGCGKKGCLETLASGKGLIEQGLFFLKDKKYEQSLLQNQVITPPLIFESAEKKDALAIFLIEQALKALAKALSFVILLFNPEYISLGGGLSCSFKNLETDLIPLINSHLPFFFHSSYQILLSPLKEKASLFGVALYASKEEKHIISANVCF